MIKTFNLTIRLLLNCVNSEDVSELLNGVMKLTENWGYNFIFYMKAINKYFQLTFFLWITMKA